MREKFVNNDAQSIYMHIPFCKRKCNYCAFVSFTNIETFEEQYVDALCEEINSFKEQKTIKTIYFGGGTPNLLSIKSVEKIFSTISESFAIEQDAEITMEFNPKLSDINYFKEIKNIGINRISLGVQSFQEDILKTLNRIHTKQEALLTIDNIQKAGFTNFSIDLMYGIFGQNIRMLKNDLEIIKTLSIPHISTYGLKIEKNTPFAKFNKTTLPDEDACADMYLLIADELEKQGFIHYEISNFAKPNFQSRHNSTYWKNEEYYGFGVGAHGYLNKIRYEKPIIIQDYLQNPMSFKVTSSNSFKDILEEKIFLGLRLKEGINLDELKNEFSFDLLKERKCEIKKFIDNGYVNLNENRLSLTTKGFLISNYIIGELLD